MVQGTEIEGRGKEGERIDEGVGEKELRHVGDESSAKQEKGKRDN